MKGQQMFISGERRSNVRTVFRDSASALAVALCIVAVMSTAAAAGRITSFDVAGSSGTYALSINAGGSATGYYLDANGLEHGFVRTADGTITTFDPAGSVDTYSPSINRKG